MSLPTDLDAEDLLRRLNRNLRRTADQATPEFLRRMPAPYFRDTDEDTVLVHLSAVVAAKASGIAPRMVLKDPEQRTWTFIHEQSYRGLLADLVEQLPRDEPLSSAKVHTANDGGLVLDVFRFGEGSRFDGLQPAQAEKLAAIVAYARGLGDEDAVVELPGYVAQCSADFVMTASPLRIYETWCLARAVGSTEAVACAIQPQSTPGLSRVSVVAGDAETRALFERYVRYLGRMGFDITRAFVDDIRSPKGHKVSSFCFIVRDPDNSLDSEGELWASLRFDLKRLRWVDDQVLTRLQANADLGLRGAEVLVALTRLIHPELAKDNPFEFTRSRMLEHLDRAPSIASECAKTFVRRFGEAPLAEGELNQALENLRQRVDNEIDAPSARRFWRKVITAVSYVQTSNLHLEDRYGLAMRVDPALFADPKRSDVPYAVLFVHADRTDAFHVRFADLARGGVRAIQPTGPEPYVIASERMFEEVYDLAFAQQLKNKDIPEGGAKAVVLVDPNASIDLSVKAFVDGLLDLLTSTEGAERLYLGPDENISPALIEWVVDRAATRGYANPYAFMSSKPGAGINHKAYGVTSEGVNVFLEESLKAIGIDPRKQAFTVKLTGGPDGDVAGNQIRIMCRDYGPRARIVGIADGSGVAWDPDGLDHDELLRLVDAEKAIAHFCGDRLGPRGGAMSVHEPDGLRRRNRLHFDVVADAFVPAGGRPATIHGDNWEYFLHDGVPSSRVIVEGANLFITLEARRRLSAAGVLIIKDSTANKCGVICSSYEIAASMLLTPDEFLASKARFVSEVLDRLRTLARSEAVRLLGDYLDDPSTPLPDRAVALSRAILRATDAVGQLVATIDDRTRNALLAVAEQHLPPFLVEAAGSDLEAFPRAYLDRTIAARLAADVVYREGVMFVDGVPADRLGARLLRYFFAHQEADALATTVQQAAIPGADRVAQLLRAGGARTALDLDET